jgi:hypothetical protein
MEAKELMIGDWVECVDSTHKKKVYAQIDAIEEGQTCILVRLDNCNWFLDISFIKPIPLTPEILEKNGFVVESRDCHGYPLQYCVLVDGLWIDISGENYFEGKLEYVHQLQHALRLCGITLNIEV